MIKFLNLLLLLLFGICNFSFSQEINSRNIDTVDFRSLPDTLRHEILKKIYLFESSDTISGNFSYMKKDFSHQYVYKLFIDNSNLSGSYTHYRNCPSCMASETSKGITVYVLYCCKDGSHHPNETAKTKADMLEIQKKRKCSKIGVCIIE